MVTLKVSIVLPPFMEVQERILQKATDLFMHFGIRSITMDEIALQLGMSKKTIYHFFADKNELADAVTMKMLDHNRDCCEAQRSEAKNAIHQIFMAMEMMQDMFENMNSSMLYDLKRYHPKAYERFLEHKYKYLHRITKENLERGIKEELYRPDISINIITLLRLESMMLPFSPNVFSRSKFSLAEVHRHIMEHFLFGIASLKGYKLIQKYKEEGKKKTLLS
ncbi:MAG: TetR/AcrR family transcriptional regulator [Chitinophagaceae bacterium]